MRIRKNAKLSPLLFSSTGSGGGSVVPLDETLQTHVCQLNQSPWDVIPFDSDSPIQFEAEEDSFTGNGSHGDSIGAVESVASMMDTEDQKPFPKMEEDNNMVVHDKEAKVLDDIGERTIEDETTSFCQKTDGKNWHCKNEAKGGQSFCEHHLPLLRSYNNNNSGSYNSNNTQTSKKAAAPAAAAAAAAAAAGARRAKARAAKRASSSSSSNPYEFYYYSGFGPLWGKRRGDRNGEGNSNHKNNNNEQLRGVENSTITEVEEGNEETTQNSSPSPSSSSSSQMDNEEFDYEVDDDEEDEDDDDEEGANGDSGKKRTRKPVKARSLKSLM